MPIDTHAHVNFNAFKDDADEVIKKSLDNDVWMINVGSQYSTSQRAVEYADAYANAYAAVGLHPVHVKEEDFDYEKYLELAKNEKVVAVGEMGLDYHYFNSGDNVTELKNKQRKVFEKAIDLANEVQKPIIIHCWDAYDDLVDILENKKVEKGGVVHCFIGGLKTAQKFIDLGFKIGLNGIITYSESYDKLIRSIDLKDILLETDCPYLTPQPLARDDRNEPIYVKYVAEKVAKVKGLDIEEVVEITTNNAKQVFTNML